MKYLLTLFLFGSWQLLTAQNTVAPPQHIDEEEWRIELAQTITQEDIKQHIYTLASDDFEGRETGTSGNDKAAEYIAEFMRINGLKAIGDDDTYFQNIEFSWSKWTDIDLVIDDTEYKHLWDFFSSPGQNQPLGEFSFNEIVFAGYGIKNELQNDYKKIDVKDKAIIIYSGEPRDKKGNPLFTQSKNAGDWSENLNRKLATAKEEGATFVFVIVEDFKKELNKNRRTMRGRRLNLRKPGDSSADLPNFVMISSDVAKNLIGGKQKKIIRQRKRITRGKPLKQIDLSTDVKGKLVKDELRFYSKNVIGLIEGRDPDKKDEYIIITAHFDHLGKRGEDVFNGADDNASGTTCVLELLEAFAHAKAFRAPQDRSILFALFTGEEKGLLGSAFYTEHPLVPLGKTMVNVNIDMLGRKDDKYEDGEEYIYVIGADRLSSALHEVNERVNGQYENLKLDYTFNAEDDPNRFYYRSDHYNFASKGIPAIFFFNGTHDDYHRPGDTPDKIAYPDMEKRSRHIFHLVWELANREEKIVVDVE